MEYKNILQGYEEEQFISIKEDSSYIDSYGVRHSSKEDVKVYYADTFF